MQQIILAILVISLVALLGYNLQRGILTTQAQHTLNEINTQFNRVGVDVLEQIGRKWFDEVTREDGNPPPTFPIITNESQLTAVGGAGWGGCTGLYDSTCTDIDDYDGLALTREWRGVPYNVTVDVRYVSPTSPGTVSGTQTYAKEVVLAITNPYVTIGGTPLSVTLSRIFIYDRITVNPP